MNNAYRIIKFQSTFGYPVTSEWALDLFVINIQIIEELLNASSSNRVLQCDELSVELSTVWHAEIILQLSSGK